MPKQGGCCSTRPGYLCHYPALQEALTCHETVIVSISPSLAITESSLVSSLGALASLSEPTDTLLAQRVSIAAQGATSACHMQGEPTLLAEEGRAPNDQQAGLRQHRSSLWLCPADNPMAQGWQAALCCWSDPVTAMLGLHGTVGSARAEIHA